MHFYNYIVSPLHPGVFIPRSGLDHPLYDSVFANTGSNSELQNDRTTETRLHHPAIMLESTSHEDVVHIADDTSSQESSFNPDNDDQDQIAQLHISSNVIYDNRSAPNYHSLEQNDISSDQPTFVSDSASFVFYDETSAD